MTDFPNHHFHLEAKVAAANYGVAMEKACWQHWTDWLESAKEPDIWAVNKYINSIPSNMGLTKIPALQCVDDNGQVMLAESNEQKGITLSKAFFLQKPPPIPQDPNFPGFPEEVAPLPRITRERIKRHALSLSPYKAPGPDGIPNIVLLKSIDVIIDHLYYIFAATINHRSYYGPWKHWTTVVLHKPGKPHYDTAKAYRPIALFNTMSKLLTSTITESITYLSDKHELLPSTHFRGCPRHTTTDAMHYLVQNVKHAWRNRKVVSALFLDVEGAFPHASTDRLIYNTHMR